MSAYKFDMETLKVGQGESAKIGQSCVSLGIKHALVVTDNGLAALGLHTAVLNSLSHAGIASSLYEEVEADPSDVTVQAAIDCARKLQVDGVIGFGGGSSMDVAKVVAALALSPQSLTEIYGIDKITQPRLPLIQVPTTAGTGSEVTPISIVTTGRVTKSGIVAAPLLPDIVILDPELTLGLPPHVTAATGVDAMVHAIEAFTSKHKKNVYSDALAKEALTLLSANILKATHDGKNMDARMAMLRGACFAGQAFANAPVAAVHALAYPLGGIFHIPHGLSNSLVLPHVMRFNAPEAQTLYAELAPFIMPICEITSRKSTTVTNNLISYLESLIIDLGLPNSLQKMKIKKSDLPMLAQDAMKQTRLLVNNPRALSEADALQIYDDAFA